MSLPLEEVDQFNPEDTYRNGASDYTDAMKKYWEHIPVQTVDQLQLPQGARVLDFGCGPGPAAIHAAHRVGPDGYVEGRDVADEMLEIARADATAAGLTNIRFIQTDFDELPGGGESFDAVTCSLALFCAKHIDYTLRKMMTYLRPGGVLAVTTPTSEILHPAMPFFTSTIRAVSPDTKTYTPFTRLTDADVLKTLLTGAGGVDVEINTSVYPMPLATPDDWWTFVMGTALRRMVMDMEPAAQGLVRSACSRWLKQNCISSITSGFNFATAVKPSRSES